MNLIIDENIAFAQEAFSHFGKAILVNGHSLTNKNLKDADALIIRSITRIDKGLLRNSKVKFVGTATIGTDHIDLDYLHSKNISFADAKGCNADSVVEYVFTALLKIAAERNISLKEKSIGVVGVGNIGSRVVRLAESLGMKVLKNDPPLERNRIGKNYVSLDELLNVDIITLHVPLSFEGKVNGTKMIYDALCKFHNIKPTWQPELPPIERKNLQLSDGKSDEEKLYKLFSALCDIEKDDIRLREISKYKLNEQADYFDLLRKTYPVRREFSNYSVLLSEKEKRLERILESFRFKVKMN